MGEGLIHYDYCLCSRALLVRLAACMEGPWLLRCFRATLDARSPRADADRSTRPTGHVPVYQANGLLTYLGVIDPGLVYDHLGEILESLNISAIVLCWLLYFKGKYLPSNSDASVSGNLIFDYYWGTELHPRVLGKSVLWWQLSLQ